MSLRWDGSSADPMSGFGALAPTAMTMLDRARATRLSATTLPSLTQIGERGADHDQDVATLFPGRALEGRHELLIGGGKAAGDHHLDLRCLRRGG